PVQTPLADSMERVEPAATAPCRSSVRFAARPDASALRPVHAWLPGWSTCHRLKVALPVQAPGTKAEQRLGEVRGRELVGRHAQAGIGSRCGRRLGARLGPGSGF